MESGKTGSLRPDLGVHLTRVKNKVEYEMAALDCPLTTHPAALARAALARAAAGANGNILAKASELAGRVGERVRLIGILDAARPARVDAARQAHAGRGELCFMTMEDETGIFEAAPFPRAGRNNHASAGKMRPNAEIALGAQREGFSLRRTAQRRPAVGIESGTIHNFCH